MEGTEEIKAELHADLSQLDEIGGENAENSKPLGNAQPDSRTLVGVLPKSFVSLIGRIPAGARRQILYSIFFADLPKNVRDEFEKQAKLSDEELEATRDMLTEFMRETKFSSIPPGTLILYKFLAIQAATMWNEGQKIQELLLNRAVQDKHAATA